MGSCISGNGPIYISKKKQTNKIKKISGCFTMCKGEDDIEVDNKISSEIEPISNIISSFSFDFPNDELNLNINKLIEKYRDKITIKKIKFEQLYNIFMNLNYQ